MNTISTIKTRIYEKTNAGNIKEIDGTGHLLLARKLLMHLL